MDRRDWLLLFIGLSGGPYPTDQIRVMKGIFLFSQQGLPPVRGLYDFTAYDYGPFDTQVYRDLDTLEAEGAIRSETVRGTNRRIYVLTDKGEELFERLRLTAPSPALEALKDVKRHVTSLSFLDLLEDVYKRYPAYAAKSVLKRP